jgi:hypothetical protein
MGRAVRFAGNVEKDYLPDGNHRNYRKTDAVLPG